MIFSIADIVVDFKGKNEYFVNRSKSFLVQNIDHSSPDMDLEMDYSNEIPHPEGKVIVKDAPVWVRKESTDKGYGIYVPYDNTSVYFLSMDTSPDWSKVRIHMLDLDLTHIEGIEASKWCEFNAFIYAGIAFRNRLIKLGGLQIHSSAIEYEGNGVLFSAPSGTGKSTHTGLWKELYGDSVTIVNDDRPAIRYIDGKAMLCGSPWSGTSKLFTNSKVPLKYIVMLEQADSNKAISLAKDRAIQLLMPRCFLPYYDQGMMEEAMCVLEKIINDIPVLLLQCRPDYEAVELVRKCMS